MLAARMCGRQYHGIGASRSAGLYGLIRLYAFHTGRVRSRQPRRPRTQGEQFAELLRERMEEQLKHSTPPIKRATYQRPSTYRVPAQPVNQFVEARRRASGVVDHPRLSLVAIILGGAGIYYVCHLEQVPSTGRWRFIDVGPLDEWKMGQEAYRSVLQQYNGRILPSWSVQHAQVNRVAQRIIQACRYLDIHRAQGAPPSQWTVHVVNDPRQKNAFVLPGGHIFVFTGILPVCENDAGLATVLAHEVAHQIARHSAEKMAGSKVLMAGAFALDMLGLDIGLSRIMLNLLLSLPNSRRIESEADELGLRIMSQACYDPRQAVQFWQRMNADEARSGPLADSARQLLSTHPVNSQRISNIQQWLPHAERIYHSQHCGSIMPAIQALQRNASSQPVPVN